MQPHHVMWSKCWSHSQCFLSLRQSPLLPCTHVMEQHSQQWMDGMEWCTQWGHVLSQHSTEASKILYFTVSGPRNKIHLPDLYKWESQFLGRLIRTLQVPKEIGVWNSQEGRKDKFFFPLHSLGLYNNNVSCLRIVSEKKLLANPVITENVNYGEWASKVFTTSRHSFDSL